MTKKLSLAFGALLVAAPIVTTVSCGSESTTNTTGKVVYSQGDVASLNTIMAAAVPSGNLLSTRTTQIDEKNLGRELSAADAKNLLGIDLTSLQLPVGDQVFVTAHAESHVQSQWTGTTRMYKAYATYITVKKDGNPVYKNRFPFSTIVTNDQDTKDMITEARRIDALDIVSAKNGAALSQSTALEDLAAFNTAMGTSITLTSGIEGKFYTDDTPFYLTASPAKQFRVRYHLKKNNKEFFNYSYLHNPTLIKSADFADVTAADKFNWFVKTREQFYWSNIASNNVFVLVNPIAKAKDAPITSVELDEMTNGYDYLEVTELLMDYKKHLGVTVTYSAAETITTDSQEIKIKVKYSGANLTGERIVTLSAW